MTCEHCTGTHYLADDPGLGACVCCTPEALQRAEATTVTLTATLAKRDKTIDAMRAPKTLAELLDELEGLAGDVRDRMAELEKENDEREEQMAEIEPALVEYLVSIGLPSHPVARPDGPLGALCVAVGVVS